MAQQLPEGSEFVMRTALQNPEIACALAPEFAPLILLGSQVQTAGEAAGVDPLGMALENYGQQQEKSQDEPQKKSQQSKSVGNSSSVPWPPRPGWAGPEGKK